MYSPNTYYYTNSFVIFINFTVLLINKICFEKCDSLWFIRVYLEMRKAGVVAATMPKSSRFELLPSPFKKFARHDRSF